MSKGGGAKINGDKEGKVGVQKVDEMTKLKRRE